MLQEALSSPDKNSAIVAAQRRRLSTNQRRIAFLAQVQRRPIHTTEPNANVRGGPVTPEEPLPLRSLHLDRKSGSAGMPRPTSYAVFCLKK